MFSLTMGRGVMSVNSKAVAVAVLHVCGGRGVGWDEFLARAEQGLGRMEVV